MDGFVTMMLTTFAYDCTFRFVQSYTLLTSRCTGKERDTESGLDYFGARYYASTMGRFMSPEYNEYDDDPEPVPYADLDNPQSLNLYIYTGNNPLIHIDADEHCWPQWLCDFVVEAKNKVLHREFTTDTTGAKIHQLEREDAHNREQRQFEEEMNSHPPEIQYGVAFNPSTIQLLLQMGRPAFVPKNWEESSRGIGKEQNSLILATLAIAFD